MTRPPTARSAAQPAAPSAVPRLGVLWCPHWPVVVAGAAPDEAVAVLHANRVVAMSQRARADGISIGQRRREAQARSPHVRIVAHDPLRAARAFDRVVQVIGALIPRVEITAPGTLTFVARGPARFYGGETAMLARMADEIAATVGPAMGAVGGVGAGVADGRFAATIAAHRSAQVGAPCTVPPGVAATAEFLAPLAVRVLADVAGLEADVVDLLQRLGVQRLGELAALPTPDVLARFGHSGVFAQRLAAGGDDRLPGTIEPPPGSSVQRDFDEPVHHSDIVVFAARQLADDLVGSLAAQGRVVTRLVVTVQTEHGEHSERVWYRPAGLNAAAIVERVRWQVDAWVQQAPQAASAATAGIVFLRLEPAEVRSDDGVQLGLWGGRTQADEWAARAVARLVAVAGEQQVLVVAGGGGRQPGDAYRLVPAATADLADSSTRLPSPVGPWPGQLPSPSPTAVHDQPLPIEVVDASGAAVRVSGRGALSGPPAQVRIGGALDAVTAWAGPWPLDERWWDPGRARRMARFQLLTGTGRLLLAAVEHQQWWLTAEYR